MFPLAPGCQDGVRLPLEIRVLVLGTVKASCYCHFISVQKCYSLQKYDWGGVLRPPPDRVHFVNPDGEGAPLRHPQFRLEVWGGVRKNRFSLRVRLLQMPIDYGL